MPALRSSRLRRLSAATSAFMLCRGWRRSWLAAARNCVLARLASPAASSAARSCALACCSPKRKRPDSRNYSSAWRAADSRKAPKNKVSTPMPWPAALSSTKPLANQAAASGSSMGAAKHRNTLR